MATDETLHAALRAWARGIYPLEAGVELMCRTNWAQKIDQNGYVSWTEAEDTTDGKPMAYPRVGDYLRGAYGYLSGGERRQALVISSFLGQDRTTDGDEATGAHPWACSLYEDLPGVDESFIRLVGTAVFHATGFHERGGYPLPWPDES